MSWRALLRPGMRAYVIPLAAGAFLLVSAFLPWVRVGDVALTVFPDTAALWVAGLGAAAALLATLSLITRRNSRHPILLVGLIALGIMFIEWRVMPESVTSRLRTRAQAVAIVENTAIGATPTAIPGTGIYIGLVSSIVLVMFGLTIVFKRAAKPYVVPDPNDDVE